MKKPSEFLNDLDAHGIYDALSLADDWRKSTGLEPCWPTHSVAVTQAAIQSRGLGGEVNGEGNVAWGYEVAEAVALELCGDTGHPYHGRGSRHREAIRMLVTAGH